MPQKLIKKHKMTEVLSKEKPIFSCTGRRKEASSRVWIGPGNGRVFINGKQVDILERQKFITTIQQPFVVTNTLGLYDVWCKVSGGGTTGQAEAVRLGVSRALVEANDANKQTLGKEGFLTRNSKEVERKKYGRKKARKRFQFSKR